MTSSETRRTGNVVARRGEERNTRRRAWGRRTKMTAESRRNVSRVFRVFVSSTFSDMQVERTALARHVFPQLQALAFPHGFRFQAIDLRWGVRTEAERDQSTMRICVGEIARCRELTPRPNFLALLGDRYGSRPLPATIPEHHFEPILTAASGGDRRVLEQWYGVDRNARPTRRWLRPVPQGAEDWPLIERRLRGLIDDGLQGLNLSEDERADYLGSATEQELRRGAFGDVDGAVHALLRKVHDRAEVLGAHSASELGDYFDFDATNTHDDAALARQDLLKCSVEARWRKYAHAYTCTWIGRDATRTSWSSPDVLSKQHVDRAAEMLGRCIRRHGALDDAAWRELAADLSELAPPGVALGAPDVPISLGHLPSLCQDAFLALARTMLEEVVAPDGGARLLESDVHRAFGESRIRSRSGRDLFEGRRQALEEIAGYLAMPAAAPLLIRGEAGSGKTALVAQAVADARRTHPAREQIVRFIGASPTASEGRTLLQDLCREIARCYQVELATVPDDFRTLAELFIGLLALGTPERPLSIYVDALDQLPIADEARRLRWLPATLPLHVHVVVTCLPGELDAALVRRLPATNALELGPMSRDEAERLLGSWLNEEHRGLQSAQLTTLLDAFVARGLPLFLKLAFEDAKMWHSEDTVDTFPTDVQGLLERVFHRLSDNANHGPVLVARALGYITVARHGLGEEELRDLLSADDAVMADFMQRARHRPPDPKLPPVIWARLYADVRAYLSERRAGGTTVFAFYHREVAEFAERRFLPGAERRSRHAQLARYFRRQPDRVEGAGTAYLNHRKLLELPFQSTRAGSMRGVALTLGSPAFLQAKVEAGHTVDVLEDFERARRGLPFDATSGRLGRATETLLEEMQRAFNQELASFSLLPASTAAHLYNNLFTRHDEGAPLSPLLRRYAGTAYPDGGRWLRRWTANPSTGVSTELLRTVRAHSGPTSAVEFSSRGDRVASGGRDGRVHIWDTATAALVATLPHDTAVVAIGWLESSNETQLATATLDGKLSVWDWEQERHLRGWAAHADRLGGMATIRGGECLVTCSDDRSVRVWTTADGTELARFEGHDGRVLCVAGDRQGKLLLSGGEDMTLRVWSLAERRWLATLRGHAGQVRSVAIARNGRWAASGADDGRIRLWDLTQRTCEHVIAGHTRRVTAIAIGVTRRGPMHEAMPVVVSSGEDESVLVHDARDAARLQTLLGHSGSASAACVDPSGAWVASGGADGTLSFWALRERSSAARVGKEHAAAVTALAQVAPSGHVVSTSRDGTARVWIGERCSHHATFRSHLVPITALLDLGDGLVVTGGSDGAIWLWSAATGERLNRWGGMFSGSRSISGLSASAYSESAHTSTITRLLRAGDDRVLSASRDGSVRLWDCETAAVLRIFRSNIGCVEHLQLCEPLGLLISGGPAGEVEIWQQNDEELVASIQVPGGRGVGLAVTSEQRLLCAGGDGQVCLLELSRATATAEVVHRHARGLVAMAAGPVSRRLALGDAAGTLLLGDLESGASWLEVPAHAGAVRVLAWDPHGTYLFSGGQDGRVVVTDARERRLVAAYSLGAPVTALCASSREEVVCGTTRGAVVRLTVAGGEGHA
jgi:WD40 repeat protein